MNELVIRSGVSAGTVFVLPDEPIVIGRAPVCHLQLHDPWISSTHARVERRGVDVWVVDLGSSNGTWKDDARVSEARLVPGGLIRFGKTEVSLRARSTSETLSPATPDLLKQAGTLFRPLADLQGLTRHAPATPVRGTLAGSGPEADADLGLAWRRQVGLLNEIGRALVDATDVNGSLSKILDTVARAVRAERAVLLVTDEHGAMIPRVSRPEGEAPWYSRTLIDAAVQNKAGVISLDAMADARFAPSRSVVAQGIRSFLCAPIWAETRILGMLVMDRKIVDPFTAQDLELATLVGYQAALAIERGNFLERAREVEAQRRKLLRHFSADIAQMILSEEKGQKDPLEATLRDDVTVLFSDVRGFTGLTERLPPLELSSLLRDYFREMTGALFDEGGTLDKFIGDGLMAIFGAPVPQPDGAVRAVRCAWDMLQRVEALNARMPADRHIAIRIGINTGWVVAGNLGTEERLEFTVLGDTVNVASRLESIARPGGVCVGATTYELTRSLFSFRPLGTQQVKGRAQPIEVFEVLGPRP